MEFDRSKRKPVDLRLVPLIDIIFFLIFFFLVAGSVQTVTVLPVDLPYATSGKILEEGSMTIVLGQYDEVLVNDELTTLADLPSQIKTILGIEPERAVVTLKADARLTAAKLIDVMDILKAAKVKNLSLVTQSP